MKVDVDKSNDELENMVPIEASHMRVTSASFSKRESGGQWRSVVADGCRGGLVLALLIHVPSVAAFETFPCIMECPHCAAMCPNCGRMFSVFTPIIC